MAIAIDNAFLYDELARSERIKRELEIAQQIQTASLPKKMPTHPKHDIFGFSLPAHEVGDDFFDFFEDGTGKFTAIVGDVSGKGTSAALYVSKIQGIITTLSEFNLPLHNLIARAKKLCVEQMESKCFITALAVQFDFQSAKASIVRASHLALYHSFGKNGKVQKILPRGVVLGYSSESRFLENVE